MKISHQRLIIITAVIWCSGGIVLLIKGGALIKQAYLLNSELVWATVALIVGGITGLIKSRFLFSKSCLKNIHRITAIPDPRTWQCFRPGMLIFLAIVIPTGAWMSRAAAGHYMLLCAVGALDISIGVALLGSSRVFWTLSAFR
jgi:hypothetical protein